MPICASPLGGPIILGIRQLADDMEADPECRHLILHPLGDLGSRRNQALLVIARGFGSPHTAENSGSSAKEFRLHQLRRSTCIGISLVPHEAD